MITAYQLKIMPQERVVALNQAVLEGDLEEINTIIDQINENYPDLASRLVVLASTFQFDAILTLLKPLI
jgi:hypothetical protein